VGSQDELVRALAAPDHEQVYAERYDAWRRQFNARDDGRAAERVVDRILDQGFLTA
jgi:CDP-glycerol glycerophosphotransferase (TagB/SpsB family)